MYYTYSILLIKRIVYVILTFHNLFGYSNLIKLVNLVSSKGNGPKKQKSKEKEKSTLVDSINVLRNLFMSHVLFFVVSISSLSAQPQPEHENHCNVDTITRNKNIHVKFPILFFLFTTEIAYVVYATHVATLSSKLCCPSAFVTAFFLLQTDSETKTEEQKYEKFLKRYLII